MTRIETPESSNVLYFEYDHAGSVLTVGFKNGSVYRYFDVPVGVFEEMRIAPSKGGFLAKRVKGVYRYARV